MKRLALLVLLTTFAGSCNGRRLTTQDCEHILDRITDLELAERGFRDPVFASRKKRTIRARVDAQLAACVGRRSRSDALECVQRARSTEELSHSCLR